MSPKGMTQGLTTGREDTGVHLDDPELALAPHEYSCGGRGDPGQETLEEGGSLPFFFLVNKYLS